MATLTVQSIVRTGLEAAYAAADVAGDVAQNDGQVFLHVFNADAGSHTVTVASQATATPGLAQADVAVAVPASEDRMIGPFPAGAFNNSSGQISATYDAVTSVTVAAIKFDKAS